MHLTKKQNWIDDLVEILKCRLKYPTTDLKEVYEDIEEDIYLCVNGEHFDEDLAKQAVSEMINAGGTTGEKWSKERTDEAAGDLLGILNYIENLQQTKNDVIMKELRKQDSVYFKQILENQARIEEKLDKLLDKQE